MDRVKEVLRYEAEVFREAVSIVIRDESVQLLLVAAGLLVLLSVIVAGGYFRHM
jgi:hypothetical protein